VGRVASRRPAAALDVACLTTSRPIAARRQAQVNAYRDAPGQRAYHTFEYGFHYTARHTRM
jgi:hypothetical protein